MNLLLGHLATAASLLTWRAGLDVALLAAGFFLLYHTVRASGTWKLVVGVLLAAGLFGVARALDLKGLEWIFSNLSSVALLGLIVVFQPEIRKILERAASLRGRPAAGRAADLADLLAEAAFALAAQRRGALVAVPGRDSLRPWVSEGIALDAEPSLPLLLSLFDPHSPGHDGAVVAAGGRLTHFGVRLPLSTSGRLAPEWGTRHHAAQGLSETTDALVVAVSEERGTVSVFHRGEVERPADPAALAARLAGHWSRAASPQLAHEARGEGLRLARQAGVSLAAAALFWAIVVLGGSRVVETAFAVPVEFTAMPPTLALAGDKPTEVTIHVSGPATDVDRLVPGQVPITIDLSRATAGRRRYPINGETLRLPRGVRLLGSEPSAVEVTLAALERRELEVRPQLVGRLPKGLRLVEVRVEPATVSVLAPAEGGRTPPLTTTAVDLAELTRSARLAREIVAPPGVRPLGDGWPDAEVRVRLAGRPARAAPRRP